MRPKATQRREFGGAGGAEHLSPSPRSLWDQGKCHSMPKACGRGREPNSLAGAGGQMADSQGCLLGDSVERG